MNSISREENLQQLLDLTYSQMHKKESSKKGESSNTYSSVRLENVVGIQI